MFSDNNNSFVNPNSNTPLLTIKDVIESLKHENTLDGSSFKLSKNIISDRLDVATTIEELLIKPNVSGDNDAVSNKVRLLLNCGYLL